ncbi:MAG: hypothetical protein Q4C63_07880 [Eubacteriales bacterium]|nr:hypothetical protein [Eubacteriales bacterium]
MKKQILTAAMTAMMAMSMAVPAMADNINGPFFYMSAVQSSSTAAPSHAQNCVAKVVDEVIDDNTYVVVYTQDITSPVSGWITAIEGFEAVEVEGEDHAHKFIGLKDEVAADVTEDGLIPVSVSISMSGHPVKLNNIYLDIEE